MSDYQETDSRSLLNIAKIVRRYTSHNGEKAETESAIPNVNTFSATSTVIVSYTIGNSIKHDPNLHFLCICLPLL